MRKNKKGFTLVELLAVIALLAILMGIAVPNVISTINNGKRNDFVSDAKRMISKAEYLISLNKEEREMVRKGGTNKVVYRFASLNAKGEFPNDPDGGLYNENSYVKVTFSENKYKYCICVVSTKRRIGSGTSNECNPTTATDCLDSTSLTGIKVVKDI